MDVFVRFKALADRKKEVLDDDLFALMQAEERASADTIRLEHLRVVCGTDGPAEAELRLSVEGTSKQAKALGDGPVDAAFNAVKALIDHRARLQLYQVAAVTEGTDAQATVTVRMEEEGRIVTGASADTDTVAASVKAYVNALNRLMVRRGKAGGDRAEVSYKDAG